MELVEIQEEALLTAFLQKHEHRIFHTFFYKRFIEEAFACKYQFLALREDVVSKDAGRGVPGDIEGSTVQASTVSGDAIKLILPVVAIKSRLFGNKITSSAYLEYGGFAGDEKYVPLFLQELEKKYRRDYDYLEIRGGMESFDSVLSQGMVKKDLYKKFVLDLRPSGHSFIEPQITSGQVPAVKDVLDNIPKDNKSHTFIMTKEQLKSTFDTVYFSSGTVPLVEHFRSNIQESKLKAIKKAKRCGVIVKEIPLSDLPKLYSLYCKNMRSFGSPPYSKEYFESFFYNLVSRRYAQVYGAYITEDTNTGELLKKEEKKEESDEKTKEEISNKEILAAALLGFCYKDRVHILIAVSDPEFQDFRPNDAVHSEFIEWALEKGYRWFDFGRVREESGQFEFKRKWGPALLELPSYFLLWKTAEPPLVDPKSHAFAVKVWKKLPLAVTNRLGMRLRKELGI